MGVPPSAFSPGTPRIRASTSRLGIASVGYLIELRVLFARALRKAIETCCREQGLAQLVPLMFGWRDQSCYAAARERISSDVPAISLARGEAAMAPAMRPSCDAMICALFSLYALWLSFVPSCSHGLFGCHGCWVARSCDALGGCRKMVSARLKVSICYDLSPCGGKRGT